MSNSRLSRIDLSAEYESITNSICKIIEYFGGEVLGLVILIIYHWAPDKRVMIIIDVVTEIIENNENNQILMFCGFARPSYLKCITK